jgi:hypothetical protein
MGGLGVLLGVEVAHLERWGAGGTGANCDIER